MSTYINNAKRILSCVFAFAMLFTSITPVWAADTDDISQNPNEALIVFGEDIQTINIESYNAASSTMLTSTVLSGGIEAGRFTAKGNYPYFYIDLPSAFGNSYDDGSVYEFEINYFDNNGGYMFVWYDAIKWGKQRAYELYPGKTKMWKTVKFTVDNAAFKGGVDKKGDIMLSFKEIGGSLPTSPQPIDIRSIKITRIPKANPILAESFVDVVGNAFGYYSKEKIVHNELRNTTNKKQKVNVEYCLIDEEVKDKVFSKTQEIEIPAKSTVTTDVNIESERCGTYRWYVNITNADGTINSVFKEDSISIIKTDPNGIKSETQGIHSQAARHLNDVSKDLIDLIVASNCGWYRHEKDYIAWEDHERIKGDLYFHGSQRNIRAAKYAKECGLNVLAFLKSDNKFYEGITSSAGDFMPSNEEAYDGFGRWAELMVKTYAPYVDVWEVWNEPNVTTFNKNGGEPEDLVELTKRVRKVVDKYDPTASVSGMCLVYIYGTGLEWRDKLLEGGIIDGDNGMNEMSLHTYHFTESPEAFRDTGKSIYEWVQEWQTIANEYAAKTGAGEIPVNITEYGFPASLAHVAAVDGADVNWGVRASILYKAHGVGDRLFYFNLERRGIVGIDGEDTYGIVTSTNAAHHNIEGKLGVVLPRYVAFTAMNYVLGGTVEADGKWVLDNDVYLNRFKSDKFNKNILAMWCEDKTETITLDLGVDKVDYYDRYGNQTTIYGRDGIFTFVLDGRPSYIVGDFKKNRVVNYAPVVEYNNLEMVVPVNDEKVLTVETDAGRNCEAIFTTHGEAAQSTTVKFENGKASFSVPGNGSIGDKSYVDVKVFEDGRLISFNQIKLTIENAIDAELSFNLVDSNNLGNWDAKLNIKNNSVNKALDGYVEFSKPAVFKELGKIDIGNVRAEESKEITFNIPNISEREKTEIVYTITDRQGSIKPVEYKKEYDFSGVIVKPKDKVVVDGIASEGEWAEGIWQTVSAPQNFVTNNSMRIVSPEDKSAKFGVMWDEENFYMYTEVTDDVYFQNETMANSWNCDGMQMGIYADLGEEDFVAIGVRNTTYHEYAIAINKDTNEAELYKSRVQDDRTAVGPVKVPAKAIRKGNITTYEVAIPWEQMVGIEGWHPAPGATLRFGMIWNDNDGDGRKGWIEHAAGIGFNKDSTLFKDYLCVE